MICVTSSSRDCNAIDNRVGRRIRCRIRIDESSVDKHETRSRRKRKPRSAPADELLWHRSEGIDRIGNGYRYGAQLSELLLIEDCEGVVLTSSLPARFADHPTGTRTNGSSISALVWSQQLRTDQPRWMVRLDRQVVLKSRVVLHFPMRHAMGYRQTETPHRAHRSEPA
jgi:hypothetical protein